jgi:hypothetical protein
MADKIKVPFSNPDGSTSQENGTLMNVTDSKEPWSEYVLEDGTKIKIKQAVGNIVKLDRKNPDGTPVYMLQGQPVMFIVPKL